MFMRPEFYETDFWQVETTHGTEIVPIDVCEDEQDLDEYVEGKIIIDRDPTGGSAHVERCHGWLGRLSGYLDCTDWHWAETEAEIKAELAEFYDLDPDTLKPLDEP